MKPYKGNFKLFLIVFSFKSCLEIDYDDRKKDPSNEKV